MNAFKDNHMLVVLLKREVKMKLRFQISSGLDWVGLGEGEFVDIRDTTAKRYKKQPLRRVSALLKGLIR